MDSDVRIDQVLGLVLDLACGKLDARLEPLSRSEPLDGVVEGLNMLAEELSASTQALKRSERSFRTLIERLPDAIFVHRDGRFIYVNAAALNLLGYENPDSFLKRSTDSVLSFDEDFGISKQFSTLRESPLRHSAREGRLFHRNGSPIEVEFTSMVVDFDGLPANLAVAHEITARKQLIAKMMEIDRMVAVGTIAAGVGHEINNPLAYIISNLDYAIESVTQAIRSTQEGSDSQFPIDSRLREALIDAREGAERVRGIVRDLKGFSRSPEDSIVRVDIEEAIESAISMTSNEIRHRAKLVREYGSKTEVAGNSSRLSQVFLNLLINAAHAIPEGDANAHQITVRTGTAQERVLIEIQDTGSGIERSHIRRLFDPFFTTKPVGQGMGLGLYICNRIVQEHGGKLQVESQPGRGATFRVVLPIVHDLQKTPTKDELPTLTEIKRARVLIIDDEPSIGRSLVRALGRTHEVSVLTDAHEALNSLTDDIRFDIVFCDLMMPEMTAVELYAEVEQRQPEMARRMFFLTGGAFTPATQEFARRMSSRFLAKPLDLSEVRRRVAESVLPRAV